MLKTPPLQTATATIDTLCGRLQSATLLEDRRAAILGLRSFAKQYPASVASGSLRELITTLRRDGLGETGGSSNDDGRKSEDGSGDVDTIRLVLETLLMLFNPDANSPEAGDEIAFFMADEFSVRQDNIVLLLNLLDPTSPFAEYYSRKYAVDILSAICAARPERLRECILSAPLGVSRLVGVLDDGRDAVRNSGLLLLVDITSGANEDLRKIVAFEEVFVKVFALIRIEGGLADAGIMAQDCLSLLANLVKGSSSNQTMFRESGCVKQMMQLLSDAFPPESHEAEFIAQSREKSTFGLLQLLRLFLMSGEASTPPNQLAFFRAGAAQTLIDLGFLAALPTPIRTVSLKCAADLIADNAPLQEAFAALLVVTPANAEPVRTVTPQTNGTRSSTPAQKVPSTRTSADRPRTYIIEALLDLTLNQPQDDGGLRTAACGLIQAYLLHHDRIRAHFLQRAISGHAQHEDAANVLSTLANPSNDAQSLMYASWIIQNLISGDLEAKTALADVREGNESDGEDVLSFIQSLGSRLQESMHQAADERMIASYLSLLTIFLWDFAKGVDDLLAEGSGLLQLLASTPRSTTSNPLSVGLACVLLGTVYEFSTKDSPIPRRTLMPLLTQKLTRSVYLDSLTQLRRDPAVRDFELMEDDNGDALLCKAFVELFSVEFSRLRRAIDKDPGVEVLPPSDLEAGVDRDVLDDLREQLQATKDSLAAAQSQMLSTGQVHEQERMSAQKDFQTATAEVERLRKINQAMQQGHESELEKVGKTNEKQKQDMSAQHQQAITVAQQESQHKVRQAVQQAEASFSEKIKSFERRIAELGNTHRSEQNAHVATRQQLDSLSATHEELSRRERDLSGQHSSLTQRHAKLERESQQLRATLTQTDAELQIVRKEVEALSSELERLNVQHNEVQEELQGKDAELAAERAGFADLEKELESAKDELVKAGASAEAMSSEDAARLKRLEKEHDVARDEAKNAKEELETMLLVMGDIEVKRDQYKARVKELGGEVTDDENEEGGDEDEDEDEDEGEDGNEGANGDADDDVD